MTNSDNTPDPGSWFKANRHEPADDGFTERLMHRLPPKAPLLLPQAAIALGAAAGFCIYFTALGATSITGLVRRLAADADALIAALAAQQEAVVDSVTRMLSTGASPTLLPANLIAIYLTIVAGLAAATVGVSRRSKLEV
jgi:hypothetical protein